MSGDLTGLFLVECDPQMQVVIDLSGQKVMKHLSQVMHGLLEHVPSLLTVYRDVSHRYMTVVPLHASCC